MSAHTPKPMQVPLLLAGIAALLFITATITIVPVREWFHGSFAGIDEMAQEHAPEAAPLAGARAKCDECAVVVSIRQLAPPENVPETYEITVRMRDGSSRVFSDASPTNWRPGARLVLISGANASGR